MEFLGCFLGVSWAFRGSLARFKSEKMSTVPRENHFFVNAVFCFLELLMVLWGSSWFVLGGFGVTLGVPNDFQHDIKSWSKNAQKKDHIWVPKRVSKVC